MPRCDFDFIVSISGGLGGYGYGVTYAAPVVRTVAVAAPVVSTIGYGYGHGIW